MQGKGKEEIVPVLRSSSLMEGYVTTRQFLSFLGVSVGLVIGGFYFFSEMLKDDVARSNQLHMSIIEDRLNDFAQRMDSTVSARLSSHGHDDLVSTREYDVLLTSLRSLDVKVSDLYKLMLSGNRPR